MTKPKAKTKIAAPKLIKVNKTNGGGLPFKIETGIPMPVRSKAGIYNELFAKMKLNDSFLIGKDKKAAAKVQYQASRWGKEHNTTFAFRATEEGHRCWRIK